MENSIFCANRSLDVAIDQQNFWLLSPTQHIQRASLPMGIVALTLPG